MTRPDRRQYDELRPVTLNPKYVIFPEGSVLMEMGQTKVLCNMTIEKGVPRWMQIQQKSGYRWLLKAVYSNETFSMIY